MVALATEVFVYVTVYFVGALVLFAQSDWRIMAPLALWFVAYFATMRVFIPRIQRVAKKQADARSDVTGRIVDSYTNIQTVKLFAHAAREEGYAKESMTPFMDTVHRQNRLVTLLNFILESLNGLLLFSVGVIGIWLWTEDAVTAGAVALAVGLILRPEGHGALDYVGTRLPLREHRHGPGWARDHRVRARLGRSGRGAAAGGQSRQYRLRACVLSLR